MSIDSSEASATAATPLGVVTLQVDGSHGVTISVAPAAIPELSDGMAVDGVILFHIRLTMPVIRASPLRLEVSVDREGDAETGQWLESMAFASGDGILQVATHDSEWLAGKGIAAEYVKYERRGFIQVVNEAAAGTALYVSVAWRVDELATARNDDSAWFAADLALPG